MRDVLVAAVIAEAEEVSSRVKMQKMIYLLQRMGFDFGFHDFSLRDFGPFSAELASTIDAIPAGMVIENKVEGTGAQGQTIVQYSYRVDPAASSLLRSSLHTHFRARSSQLRELARELSDRRTRVLEVAATAVYLRDEVGARDETQLWQEVEHRKGQWRQHFEEARNLLAEWDRRGILRRA